MSIISFRRGRRLSSAAALLALLTAGVSACRDSAGKSDPLAPVLTSISPDTATAGRADVAFSVAGTDFNSQSVVNWNTAPLPTTFVSRTELRARVPAEMLQVAGAVSITVTTPAPGGGTSAAATFTVRHPAPVIASLSADTFNVSQLSAQITITGSGFTPSTSVSWNGVAQTVTYESPTRLGVTLSSGGVSRAGATTLTVSNPPPGGGSATATVTVYSPVPVITLLPSSGATAGRPGFTLWLHGQNFVQGATVQLNGTDRQATVLDPTRLHVSLTSADVATPGSIAVAVANPGPGNRVSNRASLTVRTLGTSAATVQRVRITARDLAWDPGTGRFYLSIPSTGGVHGNSVAALDPATGAVTRSVFVGSEPRRIARSDDGRVLYVGLDGANGVRRVDLGTFTAGLQWSLPIGQVAGDLEVAPGQPSTVAVSRHRPTVSPSLDGVTVYDAGVARPGSSPGHTGADRIEFLESASVLYGYNHSGSGFRLYTLAVDAGGAQHAAETGGLVSGYYTDIVGAAGRIYGTDGSVVDVERKAKLGTLTPGLSIAVDAAMGRAYVLRDPIPSGGGLAVYDLNTFQLLAMIPLADLSFDHPYALSTRLVRWGQDGLAFLDRDELILIRSPVVAP